MTDYRVTRWVQRHRTLAGIVARLRPGLLDRLVWAEIEADPTFVAAMAEGQVDFEAGRWFTLDTATGTFTPNPDWPDDGPRPA